MKTIFRFAIGATYSALAFGVAMLGTGGGHGTDDYARVPIAPFGSSSDALEAGSALPFVGFSFWGVVIVLCGKQISVSARWALVTACGIHYASAIATLWNAPGGRDWPVLLAPYAIGQVLIWMTVARSWFRERR